MLPAHQRLDTHHGACSVDLGLVVQDEILALQCDAQFLFERHPFGQHRLHLRVEEAQRIAP